MEKINKKTLKLFYEINKILAPPPKLTVSQWADDKRVLSQESSSEHGKWKTDRAPYQREILDSINDPKWETIVVMTSAQIGKTEMINNCIGYHIDYDPAPIMLVMPTVDLCQSYSKKRLAPMIRDTPALTDKVKDAKSRDGDNTILEKGFPGGYISMVGANSPTGLSSRPIRILLADEVDRFPPTAGAEGDPLALAEKRTKTFWNRKKIFVSTPTVSGLSRIEKEFEDTTQEEWCLPCPECGKYQALEWARIVFKDIAMECKYCGSVIGEKQWKNNLIMGKWIAQNDDSTPKRRGFHLNALTSPWESWEGIINEFKKSKDDKELLKTFVNTYLGEVWNEEEAETVDYQLIYSTRREKYYAELPEGVIILTAGVDVQEDRLEIEVVGWGIGAESWGIEYKKIYGDPKFTTVWDELDAYLSRPFYFEDNSFLNIACTCVDSGYLADEVYRFVKGKEHRRIFASKGYGQAGKPFIGKPTRNNRERVALFPLGVNAGKDKIFARLQIALEGAGYCHFPKGNGYDEDYFKSLCSEKKVKVIEKGIAKEKWVKKYKRNEGLDLRDYALAAFEILNPDLMSLSFRKKTGLREKVITQKKKKKQISRGI